MSKKKPDLVISTIPFINYYASQAAKELHIPYMLICLDYDLSNWMVDIKRSAPDYFPIAIPAGTHFMYKQLLRQGVPHSKIHVVGPCLRQSFLEKKNVQAIKKEWGIPLNKKVVMIMMGGAGSSQMRRMCKRLFKMNRNLHVLACVGRDEKMAQKIARLKRKGTVSFTAIPFTKKIADLMAASDVLITKPGPNSCNEAMRMSLPVIIDRTIAPIFWEQATIDFMRDNGYGVEMKKMKHLGRLLDTCLKSQTMHQKKRGTFKLFDKEVEKIVHRILAYKAIDRSKSV